jgi:hypothetical protein
MYFVDPIPIHLLDRLFAYLTFFFFILLHLPLVYLSLFISPSLMLFTDLNGT